MKTPLRLLVVASFATATPAYSGSFDGVFVQAGIGGAHATSDIEFTGWFRDQVRDTRFNGTVSAGYSHSFGRLNLAGSVSHILGRQHAGTTVQDSPFVAAERDDSVSLRLGKAWAVHLEPGLHTSADGLIYAKLGWSRAQGRWTFSRPLYGDSFTGVINFNGLGIGAGYKHRLGKTFFAFTEAQHSRYPLRDVPVRVTTGGIVETYIDRFGATSTTAVLGLGMNF